MHRQSGVGRGFLARPIEDELGTASGHQRRNGDEWQQQQNGVHHRQQQSRQADCHNQARERQRGVDPILDLLNLLLQHRQPVGELGPLLVLDPGRAARERDQAELGRQRVDLRKLEVGEMGEVAERQNPHGAGSHGNARNAGRRGVARYRRVGQPAQRQSHQRCRDRAADHEDQRGHGLGAVLTPRDAQQPRGAAKRLHHRPGSGRGVAAARGSPARSAASTDSESSSSSANRSAWRWNRSA